VLHASAWTTATSLWARALLDMSHPCSAAPKFRAAFACPLFPRTHQACRMQQRVGGADETRMVHGRTGRKAKAKKHSCTSTLRTVQQAAAPFAFTAGARRGAAAGKLCNRPPPLLCAHARLVGWLVWFGCIARPPCSVQFSSVPPRG
jgi:hypothetical protein